MRHTHTRRLSSDSDDDLPVSFIQNLVCKMLFLGISAGESWLQLLMRLSVTTETTFPYSASFNCSCKNSKEVEVRKTDRKRVTHHFFGLYLGINKGHPHPSSFSEEMIMLPASTCDSKYTQDVDRKFEIQTS